MQPNSTPVVISSYNELLHHFAYGFYKGLIDANRWWIPLRLLVRHSDVRRLTAKCVVLNGVLFLGSMFFFNLVLIPLSRQLLLTLWLYAQSTPRVRVDSWVEHGFTLIYNLFWLYPIYVMSFGLNTAWYRQIADKSFQYLMKPSISSSASSSYSSFIHTVSQQLYRIFILLNYFILSSVYYFVPVMGIPLSFFYFCWAASLYSFEYVWMHKGITFAKRMRYIEDKWAYFLGFGFPCTLVTFFFPSFVSQGIFALLFPMYIIMATRASPYPKHPLYWAIKPKKKQRRPSETPLLGPMVSSRLPIFGIPKQLALCCIQRMEE